MLRLIDTHTHFDVPEFDPDRQALAGAARLQGVEQLVLVGYLARHFPRLRQVGEALNQWPAAPQALLAPGLHPFYILEHQPGDLGQLEQFLQQNPCVAVGEIGLDTYTPQMKRPEVFAAQQRLFADQLALAQQFERPVLLHIRRAQGEALAILKKSRFKNGGIAHAFGGGIEEARALIRLGFKLGITGQVTDPKARRLRQVVQQVGAAHLVLETDCPDMTPLCCRVPGQAYTRNTPANLPHVLDALALLLQQDRQALAAQLWHNSQTALQLA
jgi:TatD DNase family protein